MTGVGELGFAPLVRGKASQDPLVQRVGASVLFSSNLGQYLICYVTLTHTRLRLFSRSHSDTVSPRYLAAQRTLSRYDIP